MANTITGGSGAAAAGSTTLTTAREILTLNARLPGSETAAGTNNPKRVDYALKQAFDEYVRQTKCTRKTNDTLTLTADSEDFSTATLTDFDPSRLIRVEIEHPTNGDKHLAKHSSYDTARTRRENGYSQWEWSGYVSDATYVGLPRHFGWRDASNAIVSPKPDIAWKVLLTYWATATDWTIGTSDPDSVTINIPNDVIMPVITSGASYYLHKAVSPAAASLDRQLFDKHIADTRGFYAVTSSITAQREDYL